MRKKGDVQSAVGIRFDVAVPEAVRPELDRALRSAGLRATSWNVHEAAGRTYVRADVDPAAEAGAPDPVPARDRLAAALTVPAAGPGARVTSPPNVALDVRPFAGRDLEAVTRVLGGAGAPAGLVDVAPHAGGVAIEFDAGRTSLALVVATIDAAIGTARTIVPLRPLEDDVLAAFAAARLGDPSIDASRIVELYVESSAGNTSS